MMRLPCQSLDENQKEVLLDILEANNNNFEIYRNYKSMDVDFLRVIAPKINIMFSITKLSGSLNHLKESDKCFLLFDSLEGIDLKRIDY